jgi:hypothetical protein
MCNYLAKLYMRIEHEKLKIENAVCLCVLSALCASQTDSVQRQALIANHRTKTPLRPLRALCEITN